MRHSRAIVALLVTGLICVPTVHAQVAGETRVVLASDGWRLVGDLLLPTMEHPAPAVLMLNKADGTRAAYEGLARLLAERGIASLRIDLRAHGESTNLGRFVPGDATSLYHSLASRWTV